jgi:3-deoxy-D-manno-octulosonic-acid transferase
MLRYDLFYLVAALAASPVLAARLLGTGKWRTDWRGRFGHVGALASDTPVSAGRPDRATARPHPPTVLVHGVSVGEVAATRQLVDLLAVRARVVVSSTTDTGVARARSLYGVYHPVVRYPLDLSWMVRRFLNAVRPDVVVVTELEVWPNFVTECTTRGIPVCVVNGRLSASSYRGYGRARRWMRPIFRQLAAVGAQNEAYARRFADLGVPRDRVRVTDTMKWDTSGPPLSTPPAAEALAATLGLDRSRPLIVAGSTGPGEEKELIAHLPAAAQLLLVPRKPERFDAVAALHPGIRRRSRAGDGSSAPEGIATPTDLFLLDTMGELELAYTLADIAIVGRSFAPMGGSDPIPPVAAGCATVIGPHHENFTDVVSALRAGGGVTVTSSPKEAMDAAARLLQDVDARRRMARQGRRVIEERRGASARSADLVLGLLRADEGNRTKTEHWGTRR